MANIGRSSKSFITNQVSGQGLAIRFAVVSSSFSDLAPPEKVATILKLYDRASPDDSLRLTVLSFSSGVYGAGLSANVRAAYAFLAHNYDSNGPDEKPDEIFFFGFSRGAYTARSIAGLVTKLGLLTKRGMDWFPQVYAEYYAKDAGKTPDFNFSTGLKKAIGNDLNEKAKSAIKIVGVWDTVAFHGEGWGGEMIEFHNAELSTKIQYAYHAMSLDEQRVPYVPTLWQWPKTSDRQSLYQPQQGKGLQVMKQVWFSGVHADIGGGRYDPGGADITLAWMLAQCSAGKKLAFIDEDSNPPDQYLLHPDCPMPNPNTTWRQLHHPFASEPKEGIISSITSKVQELGMVERKAWPMKRTYERIHRSIRDRDFHHWPCGMLTGTSEERLWRLHSVSCTEWGRKLPELEPDDEADEIEDNYRGRIRALPGSKGGPSMKT